LTGLRTADNIPNQIRPVHKFRRKEKLNEVLQLFLHQKKKPKKTGESSSSPSGEDSFDFTQIFDSLDENEVKIELKEKQAVLKVAVRKY